MQYLTYEEYQNIGGVCDLTAFNRNIDHVCGVIDGATHLRIEKMSNVPKQVKALCRDLIEYMSANAITDVKVTSRSQSAGAVSESESYAIKTKEDQANDIDNLIVDYLASVKDDNGTPLLYRGCAV